MGASGPGRGRGVIRSSGHLALAWVSKEREREAERWVRAPGTAGIGDLPGSSSCIIEEVGFLIAQELQASLGEAPAKPGEKGQCCLCFAAALSLPSSPELPWLQDSHP